ncbi:MAG TPA: GAF domain-containing protein, partial [Candidatus Eremiobacteraceae bacterium]|nr:GAF domain-containing protein [Candidatus Eremiobacteraceae bacterium]
AHWKWVLLALCGICTAWTIAFAVDSFGLGGPAWYGWWDDIFFSNGRPYQAVFDPPAPGGAMANAGIRAGDTLDLREQPLDVRLGLAFQPVANAPVPLVIHRAGQTMHISVVPDTIANDSTGLKAAQAFTLIAGSFWLIGCAFLISLRRASFVDGRTLAIMLLCQSTVLSATIVPSATWSAALTILGLVGAPLALALLVWLSSRFGAVSRWRRALEVAAYIIIALPMLQIFAFTYALVTLRFDPVIIGEDNFGNGLSLTAILLILAFVIAGVVAAVAVAKTEASERPRAGWLLLPLPIAQIASSLFANVLINFAHTWQLYMVMLVLASLSIAVGALVIAYALLKRRVLDLEFIVGRTVVFATVSLIVVVAFTLLDWLLGTVLAGVSRTTGLVANAALALVLGLSLRYINVRIDSLVDQLFFRKRHEDERALRDFSKEAAYVTNANTLLDQAIANVQKHTDARNAVVYLDGNGTYTPVRTFGNGSVANVDENDGAILALKTWHKPLDPHRFSSSLVGALALPMLGRGRLVGVLLVGERAGGEAYANDEVEALSQFAHGVGSALDSLSVNGNSGTVIGSLAKIELMLERLSETLARRPDTDNAMG